MRRHLAHVCIVAAIGGLGLSHSRAATHFEACGELVQGVECVLFKDFRDNQEYVVENLGSFDVGDVVSIVGLHDPDCVTTCQQGTGCIRDNTIAECDTFTATGTLVAGTECTLFVDDDTDKAYVLENLGNFDVGDRVFVTGDRDPNCVTACGEGSGCIKNNTVTAADNPPWLDLLCPLSSLGLTSLTLAGYMQTRKSRR